MKNEPKVTVERKDPLTGKWRPIKKHGFHPKQVRRIPTPPASPYVEGCAEMDGNPESAY